MADTYWDHPSRRETKRLIDLADVGAILDELQERTTEWDDAREALDNLVRAANYENAGLNEALTATEAERDNAMVGWKKADTEADQARAALAKTQDHRAYLQERLRKAQKEAAGRKAHGEKLRERITTAEDERDEARAELAERKRLSTSPTRDDLTGLETLCALLHAAEESDPAVKDVAWRTFALIRAYREREAERNTARAELSGAYRGAEELRGMCRDLRERVTTAEAERDNARSTAVNANTVLDQQIDRAIKAEAERDEARGQVARAHDPDLIRRAIADPGAYVRRAWDGDGKPAETVPAWAARAVIAALDGTGDGQ
jgi:chromosome segregation ATPase